MEHHRTRWRIVVPAALATALFCGCASLHHVQIGEIDNTQGQLIKFDVKQSATGVNVKEAAGIVKAVSHSKNVNKAANTASDIWTALTFGPRTGEVTFTDRYADGIPSLLDSACPTRRLTGVTVIRETNKYPVISGEIVRVVGYCIHPQGKAEKF